MSDPNVTTLAPSRRRTAVAATEQYLPIPILAGIIVSAPTGLPLGIAAGVVVYGLLFWRASGIELRIDRANKTLHVRNFLRSHSVKASEMADVQEGEEVIARGRYSVTRVPCLQIQPHTGGRVWIQASLRNGDDKSLDDAVATFCNENAVKCLFTPADA